MIPFIDDTLLNGKKMLLVEDDAQIINVLRSTFYKFDCTVVAVGTVKDGLECIRRDTFDVVICELDLTDADGLEFFKKARPYQEGGVNILLTDFGEKTPIPDAFELGVDNIFEKPFPLPALIKTLAKRLDTTADQEEQDDEHRPVYAEF